jgi:hypothetical protein
MHTKVSHLPTAKVAAIFFPFINQSSQETVRQALMLSIALRQQTTS